MLEPARLLARLVVVSTTAGISLLASSAAADGNQVALAEALFRSGRELMAAGKFAEACPKLAESNRIDPKLGTLMNLALCHENAGKTASAWGEYVEAAGIAKQVGQGDRLAVASERASALEPQLPHVVIDAGDATGAVVTLDDQTIQAGAFGTPIPLDPGDHALRATAPGKKPFAESFAVQASAPALTLHIPALADVPPTPAAVQVPSPPSPDKSSSRGPSSQRTWGWVVGGTGVAAVGIGAFFGLSAFSDKQTVEKQCDATLRCTQAGDQARTSLNTAETVSTVAMLGGVAAVGVGVYLWLSAPQGSPSAQTATTLRIGPDIAARGLRMELSW
jgi:hypothetical protein